MKYIPKLLRATLICAFLLTAVAENVLGTHRRGQGSVRHSRHVDRVRIETDIRYEDRNAVRLQREAISAAEEAQREEGRRVRRDELQRIREEREKEQIEVWEAIWESSREASRAPRGLYYRRPGFTIATLPRGSDTVKVAGATYYYYNGVYFRDGATGYLVVTAPFGAIVKAPPAGSLTVRLDEERFFYYFGTFYRQRDGRYTVVRPPEGLLVPYLPDGYSTDRSTGKLSYAFGGVRYRPYYSEGVLVYAVDGFM